MMSVWKKTGPRRKLQGEEGQAWQQGSNYLQPERKPGAAHEEEEHGG
eukprot:CAMPEP_0118868650 /NCGR_PEP_ID=MMETSP1163-20130328/12121_1 /TAXON_ID=124430 /ORGANISM="Phaeomonas parva, Strain CCMP2877" /LENGTH=46 /DNA_ID= /DNA_START= /DNA_END= /DNA_ORIENTATION=